MPYMEVSRLPTPSGSLIIAFGISPSLGFNKKKVK
jgi:hypothetical protein